MICSFGVAGSSGQNFCSSNAGFSGTPLWMLVVRARGDVRQFNSKASDQFWISGFSWIARTNWRLPRISETEVPETDS